MRWLSLTSALFGCGLVACSSSGWLRKPGSEALRITLKPVGVDRSGASQLLSLVLDRPEVRTRLQGARYRVLRSEFGGGSHAHEQARGASWTEVEVYDYTHEQLLLIHGDARAGADLQIEVSSDQPPPTQEEIDEAVAVLRSDSYFGPKQTQWIPSPAMPGVLNLTESPALLGLGKHHRLILMGLIPGEKNFKHEIVGVDLRMGEVVRFPGGAPPKAVAVQQLCASPSANQPVSQRYIPGEMELQVNRGEEVLWKMHVVRPAVSSGARGSGIDLRAIEYRGKKVFTELHVPILTVRYAGDACGPFRDWQFMEGAFQANGKLTSDGFLEADQKPVTIFDQGQDRGNFRGVAVYTEGNEIVLTTEMESGWYRYKNEYRFAEDGTIRPLWGFASVQSSCVCNWHRHHAYWRMDFDLGNQNQVQYFDGKEWKPVTQESKFIRKAADEKWRVIDLATQTGYEVIPGPNDGNALNDAFAGGDLWALKYSPYEIDDHGNDQRSWSQLDSFVNGERIEKAKVVVWYSGHRTHQKDVFIPRDNDNLLIGPILRPITEAVPGGK